MLEELNTGYKQEYLLEDNWDKLICRINSWYFQFRKKFASILQLNSFSPIEDLLRGNKAEDKLFKAEDKLFKAHK